MHLRRALLLFAIVLGLAALATSVSRPPRETARQQRSVPPPAPEASPASPPASAGELRLPARRGGAVELGTGESATLLVSVTEPGQVDLPELGLSSPAEPLTPARFELLGDEPGSYRVRFSPAEDGEPRTLGRLVIGAD